MGAFPSQISGNNLPFNLQVLYIDSTVLLYLRCTEPCHL